MPERQNKVTATIRTITDTSSNALVYPVTIGEAVVVGKSTVAAHIKEINTNILELQDRSIWK